MLTWNLLAMTGGSAQLHLLTSWTQLHLLGVIFPFFSSRSDSCSTRLSQTRRSSAPPLFAFDAWRSSSARSAGTPIRHFELLSSGASLAKVAECVIAVDARKRVDLEWAVTLEPLHHCWPLVLASLPATVFLGVRDNGHSSAHLEVFQ